MRGTGVVVRLATGEETRAVIDARRGRGFVLEPSRSWRVMGSGPSSVEDEVLVVSQAFVEFADDGAEQRWVSFEVHGHAVPTGRNPTTELLRIAEETVAEGGLVDLLGDMGIAGFRVPRWDLVSAPHRIELERGLEQRLMPHLRGR